jgi:hypothetical protein
MTTRFTRLEDRLDALGDRLPKPAFEEIPGLEWIRWLSIGELDILARIPRMS